MSFLDKVKQFFNIGGIKLRLLNVGPDIRITDGQIKGKIHLESKSVQKVKSINVKFIREIKTYLPNNQTNNNQDNVNNDNYTTMNENVQTEENIIGEWHLDQPFQMQANEKKDIDFIINFNLPRESLNLNKNQNTNQPMFSININTGNTNNLNNNQRRQEITYSVVARADVDKAAFDPGDRVIVHLV